MDKTTFETFVIDGRHVVDAKIDIEERTVQCTMITAKFGPIPFYSEKFAEGIVVDYLSTILAEARKFIPRFDQLEKEYLNKKNTE